MPPENLFNLMQSQSSDDYAHGQIDKKIDENSLLNILTGYQTAADIPPLSTTGKITPENLKSLWTTLNPPTPEGVEAPGLGMLEWAASLPIGKAGAIGKAGGAYGSTRTTMDKLLSKYGEKAHSQIRALIDESRGVAMDVPERAYVLDRAIDRMIRIVEPDTKKQKILHNALYAEEWEEFTGILAKQVLGSLNK